MSGREPKRHQELEDVIDVIASSYDTDAEINNLDSAALPNKRAVDESGKEGMEEERRLFYVAVTRSQKFLFMTHGPIAGKNNRYAKPSDFWNDVLVSKLVKRRRQSYADRERLPSTPKQSVANVTLSFSDMKYFFVNL